MAQFLLNISFRRFYHILVAVRRGLNELHFLNQHRHHCFRQNCSAAGVSSIIPEKTIFGSGSADDVNFDKKTISVIRCEVHRHTSLIWKSCCYVRSMCMTRCVTHSTKTLRRFFARGPLRRSPQNQSRQHSGTVTVSNIYKWFTKCNTEYRYKNLSICRWCKNLQKYNICGRLTMFAKSYRQS